MILEVGKVPVSHLGRHDGIVYDFAKSLAASANRIGEWSSLGYYDKDEMEQAANQFFENNGGDENQSEQLRSWIENLPWNMAGYLTLLFDWGGAKCHVGQ
ncbi:MAG: hypothetical protein ACYC0V_21715 [Armatimonadota bacterium]